MFSPLQKEATGALTHAGAHLDLSAFSSWEVSTAHVFRISTAFKQEKYEMRRTKCTVGQGKGKCSTAVVKPNIFICRNLHPWDWTD